MTDSAPQEIEAKFLVEDPSQVEPLRSAASLAPGYDLGEAFEVIIIDGDAAGIERYQRAQDKAIDRLSERVAHDFEHFISHLNRRRLAMAIAWI